MIIFKHKEKEYSIPNEGEEITLRQLVNISEIMQDKKLGNFERWLKMVEYLGGKKLASVITDDALMSYIDNFHAANTEIEIQPNIEVEGVKYSVNLEGDDIVLTGRELAKIEEIIGKDVKMSKWGAKVFAIAYKQEGITSSDHLNDGHIKKKSDVFLDKVNGNVASPIIMKLAVRVFNNAEKLRKTFAKS